MSNIVKLISLSIGSCICIISWFYTPLCKVLGKCILFFCCSKILLIFFFIFLHFSEPSLETQQAAGLIVDAEKCKLLLSSLHETSAR